jgi:NAD(P)-dependent dehydrogenase (short-subunit alcohol dehydrogenase family)
MKTVLITGASKGIGLALAELLLNEGYFVIGTSRNGISKLTNANLKSISLEISDESSIELVSQFLISEKIKIDILVNNAGIGPDLETEIPCENTFQKTFDTNVTGLVFFTEKMLDLLNPNAEIYNISSKMGSIGLCVNSDSVAYRLSKAAVNMYSKILANRLLSQNIKVVTIHPGWVKTGISPNNIPFAPLVPGESAIGIYKLMKGDKTTGSFWNAQTQLELEW